MNQEIIMIDGVRYYADRPNSCRGCFFWKNRKAGCSLKKENCYYLAESPKKTSPSVKDFIAPTAFAFPGSRTFQMGSIFGAMSYLQITASDLSDQLLKDFLDMDSSQIITMHIQSVDQTEAIKTIKHTITELDRSKIEEQKKAVRSGYDILSFLELFQGMTQPSETQPSHGLTPSGNLTLVDDFGERNGEGQQFVTLVTKNGNYFYLIIDRDEKGEETVHFLNLVDERDLFALMEDDEKAAYESQLAAEQAAKEAAEKAAAEAAAASQSGESETQKPEDTDKETKKTDFAPS